MSKKGMSPLFSTLLLVVFALAVGAITMTRGKAYVENIQPEPKQELGAFTTAVIISLDQIDDPLKNLQVYFLTGKLNREHYLEREAAVLAVEQSAGSGSCIADGDCVAGFSCWHQIPAATFQGIPGMAQRPGKCYNNARLESLK